MNWLCKEKSYIVKEKGVKLGCRLFIRTIDKMIEYLRKW